VPDSRERALEKAGIARFHGVASFRDRHTIDFAGHSLTARHFVIASGAAPVPLGIPGEDLLLTSDDFLELETLPRRMVFIGGGYIAFEFAHLAARAGSQVTILHRGARALERFDSTLVDQLTAWTRQIGIDVRLNAPVTRVERAGAGFVVHAGDSSVEAVAVVHAAGRAANIGALNLAGAGVESTGRGVTVNEFLQSPSNPAVYAAGDSAASGPQLTPIAGYHGRVVAANLLRGNHLSPNYDGFASTVFTVPPLASTGLTEDEARKRSLDFDVHAGDSSNWYSTRRVAAECSGYKILIEKTTDRILGAHILGPGAEEMINVFALAIRHRLSATAVRETLFAYPTHGSDAQYML
jgi:glutathione reductase (NADPH)